MKVMRLLLFLGALVWAVSCGAQSAEVHEAARTGDLRKLKELIGASPELVNAKGEQDDTPLHSAAMMGKMDAALFLIEKGAAIDARNTVNQSPLLYAAYGGHAAIVDTLLARGAQFDYQDTRGFAPIHFAARKGNRAVVELLVSKGAPFDNRGFQGRTPLHFAAMNGHTEIVKFLAARGAKLDTRDDSGTGPLASALAEGHVETAELLLGSGAAIEGDDATLASYLHRAAAAGSARVVDALVAKGAPVDGRDEAGRTLLHDAAIGGLTGLARTMIARVKNVDTADGSGKTALHYAVSNGRGDVVDLLLVGGADPNVADLDGRTPLHSAEDASRSDIAKLLRKRGARDVERRVYRLARAAASPKGRNVKSAPLEITYIGNEGFLISRGERKVIIDALHMNPWNYPSTGDRVFSMMLEDRSPFDGVDLSVVSHAHADHMSPRMTAELLKRNPGVAFVSSPLACDSLRMVAGSDFEKIADRVVSVDPEWKETVKLQRNGIDVELFGVNHNGLGTTPYKTLATVIDLDGIRVVHLADEAAESNLENFEAVDLGREGIDIAFADRLFLADSVGQYIMKELVKPEYIILMHAWEYELDTAAKQLMPLHANLLIYREQLEKRIFGF
jgi:ankyrin repeat protein/L-ascorbate metabolism protein UlaG (beta-lactamase superfamily)